MDINQYWPHWREDIGNRRAISQTNIDMGVIDSAEVRRERAILANQQTILKALFWLLSDAEERKTQ